MVTIIMLIWIVIIIIVIAFVWHGRKLESDDDGDNVCDVICWYCSEDLLTRYQSVYVMTMMIVLSVGR